MTYCKYWLCCLPFPHSVGFCCNVELTLQLVSVCPKLCPPGHSALVQDVPPQTVCPRVVSQASLTFAKRGRVWWTAVSLQFSSWMTLPDFAPLNYLLQSKHVPYVKTILEVFLYTVPAIVWEKCPSSLSLFSRLLLLSLLNDLMYHCTMLQCPIQ